MGIGHWLAVPITSTSVLLLACGFKDGHGASQDGPVATSDAPPDALSCTTPTVTCSDDMTLSSSCPGDTPVVMKCGWGCRTTPTPHCGVLLPSGGAVTGSDFMQGAPSESLDGTSTPIFVDTDTATIMSGSAGSAIVHGHTVANVGNGVTIFSFQDLQLSGMVYFYGIHAAAFVATGSIVIDGVVDARNYTCATGSAVAYPGPGGFAGGDVSAAGSGSGSGGSAVTNADGGGGGAYGGSGAVGGYGGTTLDEGPAGSAWDNAMIAVLVGGGGGGAGGGSNSTDAGGGSGGGGGGAVQLASNTAITINGGGGINVGGCGGGSGSGDDGGGGGGAGGAILLEAPTLSLSGTLAANGGGGGGGDQPNATAGGAGLLGSSAATGGSGHNSSDENGGNGAAAAMYGGSVPSHGGGHEGGGGGGAGYIRINTLLGMPSVTLNASAIVTPSPGSAGSPASVGSASVQ